MEDTTLMPIGNNSEIVIYQPDADVKLEVHLNGETVWLNRQQMAVLFDRDVKTIGKHVNNALAEELDGIPVVANFATTAADGKTYQVEYYNLDVIISVGFRVKSRRGVLFRKWANAVLKEYLLRGYSVNQQLLHLEHRIDLQLQEHSEQIHNLQNQMDFFVRTALPPVEGIFYDGQIFDAYSFVSDLVRSAKERIVLFDNYVDDTVLTMLDKRVENVSATIFTKAVSAQLELDIAKHNAQYRPIEIKAFDKVHDRFLCIDSTVYHIGASLKDLGKKWFAFSRMEMRAEELVPSPHFPGNPRFHAFPGFGCG